MWLVVSTPLKNMKVSWDDSSQYMEKKHVPNHQPNIYFNETYIYICWDEPLASVRQNFAMIANLPVMFSGKVQELRNIAHKAC